MLFYLFAIAAIVALFYYWYTLKFKYFEELGIPGPKAKFPYGNTPGGFNQKRNVTYDLDDMYQ